MDVRIQGQAPADPFLGAADLFRTEHDLDRPVRVHVREDPDERTWTAHYDDHHVLNISRQAASSAMSRELALHEFAHMARHEEGHPSHTQSTEEALFLALAGRSVERRRVVHCYQIANHMKDIYADDITLSLAPADKLVQFLESGVAAAVAGRADPAPYRGVDDRPGGDHRRVTPTTNPDLAAVNAAFALALVERHDLVDPDHRLYDLARVAAGDAAAVSFDSFRRRFRSLARDPSESDYRRALVDVTREYAVGSGGDEPRAAD
ncbi:MAG: DUF5781 family protein [Haloferacaceae archaeon]